MSIASEKSSYNILATLAITLVALAAPLGGHFLYVANANSGKLRVRPNSNISACSIDPNWALGRMPASPFATGIYPWSVAVDPSGNFVYAANYGNSTISAYNIASNGALIPVSGSPFILWNPYSVAVAPWGKFVYTPIPGSPFAPSGYPWSVAVNPTGKFVYVANTLHFMIYGLRAQAL